jgi:hypothetical protein
MSSGLHAIQMQEGADATFEVIDIVASITGIPSTSKSCAQTICL